jgi:hypothetical protein
MKKFTGKFSSYNVQSVQRESTRRRLSFSEAESKALLHLMITKKCTKIQQANGASTTGKKKKTNL